jgi:hypothetical protein
MVAVVDDLLTELIAIRCWDADYLHRSTHDQLDRMAWDARRKREAEIIRILAARAFSNAGQT